MCNRRAVSLVDRLDPRRRTNVDDPVEKRPRLNSARRALFAARGKKIRS